MRKRLKKIMVLAIASLTVLGGVMASAGSLISWDNKHSFTPCVGDYGMSWTNASGAASTSWYSVYIPSLTYRCVDSAYSASGWAQTGTKFAGLGNQCGYSTHSCAQYTARKEFSN